MTGSPPIRLSFFPLKSQTFSATVWRKPVPEDMQIGRPLYRTQFSTGKGADPENFAVSFSEAKGFVPYKLSPGENWHVTTTLLFHALERQTRDRLKPVDFYISEKAISTKRISYTLSRSQYGEEAVWLEPYYLEATVEFGFLSDFQFHKAADAPFSREVQRLSLSLDKAYRSNRDFYIDRFERIQKFLSRFQTVLFPLSLPGGASVEIETSFREMPSRMLPPRTFSFGGNKQAASQWQGLKDFGPARPAPKPVGFIYIYRQSQRGLAEDLYRALSGRSFKSTFHGIEELTHLKVASYDKLEVRDFNPAENARILSFLRTKKKELANTARLFPIIMSDRDDKETYYTLKSGLLKEGVTLQVVTPQLLGRKDTLKWSVANIALQIFTKAGGTAWSVVPKSKKCLIVGIGQAHRFDDNGKIEKFFAYSVCTDSSGLYKSLNILGSSGDKAKYLDQIRDNIVQLLNDAASDYTECVVHVPYKIKKHEAKAISRAIGDALESSKLPPIRFTVLNINVQNKFFGYAATNSLVPYEGSVVKTGDNDYLAWFDGLQPGREVVNRRISAPVNIKFWWSSGKLSEDDRARYIQDVSNLAGTNWRGFNAKNTPISIYYCELIARFAKERPDALDDITAIDTPWFL